MFAGPKSPKRWHVTVTGHPFIISKLGSVVGPRDMLGIYFYGDYRAGLYSLMNYPEYKSDLHHIHQSEVYGATVFKMAGRLTFSGAKRAKWTLLYALEEQTLERFLNHLDETGQDHHYPTVWALKGHFEGIVLGLLPWSIAMRLLAHETQSFRSWVIQGEQNILDPGAFACIENPTPYIHPGRISIAL